MDFESVIIYLSVFLTSLLCMWLGQNQINAVGTAVYNKRQKKFFGIFFFSVALLLPILLAGVRDTSVGNDINGYVLPNFEFAQNDSLNFSSFYRRMPVKTELLYAALLYIFGKMDNLFLFFTVIETLALVPIFIVLFQMRKQISISLGMAMYYFFFFNFGLSATRQIISMSLLFLAYFYLDKREYKKVIALSVIAFLFHSSVAIIIAIYFVVNWILKSRYKKIILSMVIIFMLLFFMNYEEWAEYLARLVRLVNPRYAYYIRHYLLLYTGFVQDNIPMTYALCQTVLVLIVAFFLFLTNKTEVRDRQLLFFVLLGEYFILFNGVFYESQRIAYYLNMFLLLYVPNIFKCFKNNFLNKFIVSICLLAVAMFYWFYDIMYIGSYATERFLFR
ncbi:MAG: EpsG family protein [Eubacterium sp.]|nr:EpsG family protein [Eubacterium sp.]